MEPDRTQIRLDPRYTADLLEILKTNYSVPSACFSYPPTAAQLLRALGPVDISLMVIMTLFVLGSIAIFLEAAVYLHKNTRCPIKRKTLIWCSSSPTIVSAFSCFGLWIPRALTLVEMAITTFYSMCFYLLMQAMVEGFGGKEAVLRTLKDTPVMIHTGPCCCCCPCCPRIKITRKRLQLLLLGPIQYAFFKISLTLVGLFLIPDGIFDPSDISEGSTALWINTFLGVSTLSALWTIGIIFRQARLHLGEQNIGAKFVLFQALLILSALQPSIFSVLASGGQIACSPPFSSKIRSQVMNCHLLILESFLITVLTRIYYRRKDDKLGYEPFSSPDQDLNLKA
ncbi:organic solute transporter subunit alpha [Bos indicus]|uniref:Organic solute transporter subunit alpha n=5 Tax=Bos TaxID=9903 RepID=OSTA_BOVIN|nr:organic solute transporter subunit alpha isoform X1 [Bos taurus]XP_005897869.1 PREDICTED: organic solute transporter subunit alpha isoform X1 [Bos mutus]XP_027393020.1 organic solute transporter subunit alpha [Bos indicus x Bos taurus]XP_061267633.1 organic solute transporter subunit alpha [Bos javanicus]Q3T124.1 RecName: Full=Organic solute transporter subunit alpha; Short=OST-alpha; AltName: Full=Solute carrier family 51 subunit alpha [Bos taurus]AAI02155.1 OSTALPHA protein [Bos taurus]E